MLELFLNIKTRRVIPTDTWGIFFTARVSQLNVNTMERFLSSSLNSRLLNIWYFIYCPVVIKFPALSFDTKRKQRGNEAFVSPKLLYSIRSVYILRECMRTVSQANFFSWGPFPINITPNALPTLPPKMCPRSVLKVARPDPSVAK